MKMPAHPDMAGFTLLEVLVALAILAIASAGMLRASGQTIGVQERLEEKTLALLIAHNKLTEMQIMRQWPEPGNSSAGVAMAERRWQLDMQISGTANPGLRRVNIAVSLPPGGELVTLSGFVGKN